MPASRRDGNAHRSGLEPQAAEAGPSLCVCSIQCSILVMRESLPFWLTSHWNSCFSSTLLAFLFPYPSLWSHTHSELFVVLRTYFLASLGLCTVWVCPPPVQPHPTALWGATLGSQSWWPCSCCFSLCPWLPVNFLQTLRISLTPPAHSTSSANIPRLLHLNSFTYIFHSRSFSVTWLKSR